MPYTCKGNDVVRSDTGALVKHHPTHAKALAHLRALKANVESQEATYRWLDEHAQEWLPTDDQLALEESEKTAGYSVTHSPLGKPGGPGLWKHKGLQLPAYIQNVAKGIMKSVKDKSRAIATAIATVKRWARGGGKVSPEVRAAAAKAVAEWERLKASH
jgi:hypothetical protein